MTTTLTTWTADTFLQRYPEYAYAGAMIEGAIADAARKVDPNYYDKDTEEAVGLMAAIALAGSPLARTQQLNPDGNKVTEYEKRLDKIKLQHRVGFIVL
jgi:hypothetical protein